MLSNISRDTRIAVLTILLIGPLAGNALSQSNSAPANTAPLLEETKAAITAYELAATRGDAGAMTALGDIYSGDILDVADERLAMSYYKSAGERGLEAESLRKIAGLYRSESGALHDPGQAFSLYQQAAALGDLPAAKAASDLSLASGAIKTDELKAAGYFELAIKSDGNATAMAKLAALYRSREGDLFDLAKARQLYDSAAIAGDKKSQLVLGLMHETGEGGAADESIAQYYYELAFKLYGLPEAAFSLARLYRSPAGALHDIDKAISYYEIAAVSGDARAYLELAKMFAAGEGIEMDEARSESYVLNAKAELERDAARLLGDIYFSKDGQRFDLSKAVGFYVRAAELGDPGAKIAAGDAYVNGTGVAKDESKALEYFQSAAETAMTGGLLRRMGVLYRSQEGTLFDINLAIRLLHRAAALGDGKAMLALGDIYSKGEGTGIDEERSQNYYQTASEAGKDLRAAALRGSAFLHRSKTGALFDIARAQALFEEAANLGDTQSMTALGEMYATGEITTVQQ